jgi:hypothetical protein
MTSAARAPRPVRRPAAADAPAPPRLDNLTVSRKEGFRAFAEAPTRHQPENLTVAQLAALSDRAPPSLSVVGRLQLDGWNVAAVLVEAAPRR